MASGVPDDVAQFVRAALSSVQQLEVLLLLRASDQALAAEDVATRLKTHAGAAATCLQALALVGLAAEDADGYRYAPGGRAALVDRLSELYPTYRTRITGLIYSEASDAEAFADAFRLRRRKES